MAVYNQWTGLVDRTSASTGITFLPRKIIDEMQYNFRLL